MSRLRLILAFFLAIGAMGAAASEAQCVYVGQAILPAPATTTNADGIEIDPTVPHVPEACEATAPVPEVFYHCLSVDTIAADRLGPFTREFLTRAIHGRSRAFDALLEYFRELHQNFDDYNTDRSERLGRQVLDEAEMRAALGDGAVETMISRMSTEDATVDRSTVGAGGGIGSFGQYLELNRSINASHQPRESWSGGGRHRDNAVFLRGYASVASSNFNGLGLGVDSYANGSIFPLPSGTNRRVELGYLVGTGPFLKTTLGIHYPLNKRNNVMLGAEFGTMYSRHGLDLTIDIGARVRFEPTRLRLPDWNDGWKPSDPSRRDLRHNVTLNAMALEFGLETVYTGAGIGLQHYLTRRAPRGEGLKGMLDRTQSTLNRTANGLREDIEAPRILGVLTVQLNYGELAANYENFGPQVDGHRAAGIEVGFRTQTPLITPNGDWYLALLGGIKTGLVSSLERETGESFSVVYLHAQGGLGFVSKSLSIYVETPLIAFSTRGFDNGTSVTLALPVHIEKTALPRVKKRKSSTECFKF